MCSRDLVSHSRGEQRLRTCEHRVLRKIFGCSTDSYIFKNTLNHVFKFPSFFLETGGFLISLLRNSELCVNFFVVLPVRADTNNYTRSESGGAVTRTSALVPVAGLPT